MIKQYIEPGVEQDDLVLYWDNASNRRPEVAFFHHGSVHKTTEYLLSKVDPACIIKCTKKRARMTTKELMDTVVNKVVCPFCGSDVDYCNDKNIVHWYTCANLDCLFNTPVCASKKDAKRVIKSIKVVMDEE